ncbi:MAG: hypothetical protein JWO46_893 [Nocardioidaceae bacterium]|nr:hypothetical protein [Nocardioidaceae bacterium]
MSASSVPLGRDGLAKRARRVPGVALSVAVLVVGLVLVAPFFLPSPTRQHLTHSLASPSGSSPLGTDQLGRDMLARVVAGVRLDLIVAVGALVVPILIGAGLGALAGWYGGWVDEAIGVVADVVQAFPYYLFIIVLAFFLGAGVTSILVAVAAVAWVSYMRNVRAEVQAALQQDYVRVAIGAGYSTRRILVRHVLPNVYKQPLAYALTDVVVVIVSTATLSYLGVGIAPPTPELGALVSDGQQFLTSHPLLAVAPGLAVVLIGVVLSVLGNALHRRLDDS